MAIGLSTARWVAPTLFLIDTAVQLQALLASPSMVNVHYANISFFSPDLSVVMAGFVPLQLLMAYWLYKLCKLLPSGDLASNELDHMLDLVPYFLFFHCCLASWAVAWTSEVLGIRISFIPIALNAIVQNYYMVTRDSSKSISGLTSYLSTAFAAISIVDFLHVGSVAFFNDEEPIIAIKIATGLLFAFATIFGNPTYGACLTFGLLAFAAAQDGEWRTWLSFYTIGAGVVGAVKSLLS